MKISTKGRYGLRLMLDLALSYEKGLVSLRDVAARQEISEKYLEQIIMPLGRAGLVKSTRGAQGGYRLQLPPEEISVGDVLRVTEGSLTPVGCLDDTPCARKDQCVTYSVWGRVQEAITDVVDHITLQDLVEDYHRKNDPEEKASAAGQQG
ncbi:RrF2 family transcriptional regulator [Zongyangia hominis]|uniref:Rrf2 family transcriptional regulator n=1 Tax=Zongyangia hominis TaxID=2763677 RepID=A0A926EBQ2_9FIRM|nr:Rrf2 family transcriptional regulator [Zongyangia hominis]MBC8570128.1 Rrf2 family transcriptional regulator [Zongyangia hominis]